MCVSGGFLQIQSHMYICTQCQVEQTNIIIILMIIAKINEHYSVTIFVHGLIYTNCFCCLYKIISKLNYRCTVQLLSTLITTRGKKMNDFLVIFEVSSCSVHNKYKMMDLTIQGEYLDVEECITKLECSAACIAAFGSSITDIKVIIEKENILPMPSMKIAIHCCFAIYYILNISYPATIAPLLLFLEHVYQLPFSKKVPLCVSTLIDSLEKLPSSTQI